MIKENYLFEISWEVCNKVGGIYTVITSKIFQVNKYFKNYYLIGPYLNKNYKGEFEEIKTPINFKEETEELENIGIKLHFGKWINQNNQQVILVEYLKYSININEIKSTLWKEYKIDSLNSNWYDFDEAILWSWCCGISIEKLSKKINSQIFIHSHEWMSGGSIFYLKQLKNLKENSNPINNKYNLINKYNTIFTTHATMLGRTISSSKQNLYNNLEKINPDKKAYELGIHTKHQTEKALADLSDCFTTVSKITNLEAKFFYKKEADMILPNGFDSNLKEEEIISEFNKSRENINNFLTNYSKNIQDLNLKNSKVFYTSGRNEFKDKGVDIYIKALGKLNEKLKKNNNTNNNFNNSNFNNKNLENNNQNNFNIINFFLIPIGNFKKTNTKIKTNILPFSTHEIPIENNIIKSFLDNKLFNLKEDKIKVVILPFYISKNDEILNQNYYDLIQGMDLGIFPSLYEPWGYTPLESIAYSVPTITSNLSGFGIYCEKKFENNQIVNILNRKDEIIEEKTINELLNILNNYIEKDNDEIIKLKKESLDFSKNFSWDKFYNNYIKAYEFSLKKTIFRNFKNF